MGKWGSGQLKEGDVYLDATQRNALAQIKDPKMVRQMEKQIIAE
mgnify:CR=1 FL=1